MAFSDQKGSGSMNPGEEIVAVYLQYIKGCEFTQVNLYTPDVQGEIDVLGINLAPKELYVCEVAIHLPTGLKYTKEIQMNDGTKKNQPNNVSKLIDKFSRDIEYANKHFPDYEKYFMLWTPIVKHPTRKTMHDQMKDVEEIRARVKDKYGVEIDLIVNENFLLRLKELRDYAAKQTKELKSPILRLMQIEEYLIKHVEKLKASASDSRH